MGSFFQKLFGRQPPPAAARQEVFVSAFGKHPGWDDHFEVGIETDCLAMVRQAIYMEGIAGNIDAGVWDRLTPDRRLVGFDHFLLWREPEGCRTDSRRVGCETIIVGRLWNSRDGKGRDRYPMALAAQCTGWPMTRVARCASAVLESASVAAREVTTAGEIATLVSKTRDELRQALKTNVDGSAMSEGAQAPISPNAGSEVLRRPGSSDDQIRPFGVPQNRRREDTADTQPPILTKPAIDEKAMRIVLYHLERSAAAGGPSIHLRVPAGAAEIADSCAAWEALIRSALQHLARPLADEPILCLQAREPWLDIIIGRPQRDDLFCIRARETALPLTTDIPYNLDADFVSRATQLLARI